MCGIAGTMTLRKSESGAIGGIDPETITRKMIATLIHRGPDDHGVWANGDVAFGHRRLEVIDLEGGKQPMADPQDRVWLVFNGEIYNFQDLKNQLLLKGHSFKTCSDTEVLLHAYLEQGLDCLEELEGMFAFAVWDRQSHKLHLARDRLGIKPLYWMRHDHRVYFASEIKALLEVPGWKPALNPKVLAYYLSHYQPIMNSETLFQGINSVEPGTVITFQGVTSDRHGDSETPHVARYWSFPVIPNDQREDRGEGYYAAKVRDLLSRSVERQSYSDVPLGAYLSGGLDSTILVGLLQQLSDQQIRTYSIGFDDSSCNEFPYSQLASKLFGTNHTEIGMCVDDYFPAMEELIRFKDAPLSVPNEVPLFLMSKVLKDDITVVLSGEGADELFAGYAPILRTPYDYKSLMQKNGSERREFLHKLSSFYNTLDFDDELSHFRAAYCWLAPEELRRLLKPAYQLSEDNDPIADYWAQKFQPLEQMLPEDRILNILETVHLSGLLARLDTTTMAASVEGRVPFTDTDLLEFAAGIPLEYKLRWRSPEHAKLAEGAHCLEIAENLDIPKYILKRSFQDMVPQPIIERRKLAFPVPLDQWFQGSYRDYVWNTIHQSKIMPDVFDIQEVERLIHKNETPNYSMKVWMLLNVSIWLDAYFT